VAAGASVAGAGASAAGDSVAAGAPQADSNKIINRITMKDFRDIEKILLREYKRSIEIAKVQYWFSQTPILELQNSYIGIPKLQYRSFKSPILELRKSYIGVSKSRRSIELWT
jgi:hypothetical protein